MADQESGKVKLRLTNKGQHGKVIILPGVGEVKVGEDGIFTVEAEIATILLNQGNDYLLVKGNGTTVTAEAHPEKLDEETEEVVLEETEEEDETEDEDTTEDETEDETTKEVEEVEDKEETTEEVEETEEETTEEESDGLEDMKLSELIDLAKEAGFSEEDYKKFKTKKKLMVNFIRKNAQ